ncbi:hypothetical protein HPB47_013132, partial [Ixodes persulcatus]
MALLNITPLKPLLDAPGRPPVPWEQWYQRFKRYRGAAGTVEFSPARRQSSLFQHLGDEGQRIYDAVIVSWLPSDINGISSRNTCLSRLLRGNGGSPGQAFLYHDMYFRGAAS